MFLWKSQKNKIRKNTKQETQVPGEKNDTNGMDEESPSRSKTMWSQEQSFRNREEFRKKVAEMTDFSEVKSKRKTRVFSEEKQARNLHKIF